MSILLRKERDVYYLTGITKLALVSFISTLAFALTTTIWAIYLDSFLHSEVYVGLLSAALTLVGFSAYFFFIPLIEKADKSKVFIFSIFASILGYLLFTIIDSLALLILLSLTITAFQALRVTSFGIIIKDNSKKKVLSKHMGLIYTFANTAWVVGPLISGYVASQFGLKWVFVTTSALFFITLLIFRATGITDTKGKKDLDTNIFLNFKDFFKSKDRVVAYSLHAGINMWWMMIYIFMPLMMVRRGLSELVVGYFLFAVALPLITLEYALAKWANKKGFRKIFKIGYLFVSLVVLVAFFMPNIYVIMALLVLASCGMAMLEPTTVAYFFDILKGKERYRFYGPFNTAADTGGLIGKLLPSLILIFLPFKFIFLLMAALMFTLFLVAFKAKNIVESK